jgi:hypothetical protein
MIGKEKEKPGRQDLSPGLRERLVRAARVALQKDRYDVSGREVGVNLPEIVYGDQTEADLREAEFFPPAVLLIDVSKHGSKPPPTKITLTRQYFQREGKDIGIRIKRGRAEERMAYGYFRLSDRGLVEMRDRAIGSPPWKVKKGDSEWGLGLVSLPGMEEAWCGEVAVRFPADWREGLVSETLAKGVELTEVGKRLVEGEQLAIEKQLATAMAIHRQVAAALDRRHISVDQGFDVCSMEMRRGDKTTDRFLHDRTNLGDWPFLLVTLGEQPVGETSRRFQPALYSMEGYPGSSSVNLGLMNQGVEPDLELYASEDGGGSWNAWVRQWEMGIYCQLSDEIPSEAPCAVVVKDGQLVNAFLLEDLPQGYEDFVKGKGLRTARQKLMDRMDVLKGEKASVIEYVEDSEVEVEPVPALPDGLGELKKLGDLYQVVWNCMVWILIPRGIVIGGRARK